MMTETYLQHQLHLPDVPLRYTQCWEGTELKISVATPGWWVTCLADITV